MRLLLRRGGICCLYRLFRLRCCHQLRKGLLLRKPRLVVGGGIDDNGAAHLWVSDAAELGAENLEAAGARRRQPEIGDHARHHVHLGAELRHVEIVDHIDRAQEDLHRLSDFQMQFAAFDDDVIKCGRIVAVEAERILGGDVARFRGSELAVGAWQAEAP